MFGNVGRKLVEGVVGLFAVLGFLYVPLGRLTGFEHACAVLSTPAATAAVEDVSRAVIGLRQRALSLLEGRSTNETPKRPRPPGGSQPGRPNDDGPRPAPPPLK